MARRAPRVAIVGAGPAGAFAAAGLLRARGDAEIDFLERLPTPWGLLRGGVAPDHQEIKRLQDTFERQTLARGCRFLGNVEVGTDISHAELMQPLHRGRLRDRRADRQVARHPRRGPARQLGGHRVRGLVQRPPRLPRPRVRPVGPARGGHRQRQRRGRRRADAAPLPTPSWSAPTSRTTRSRRCARAASRRSSCSAAAAPRRPRSRAPSCASSGNLDGVEMRVDPADVELDAVSREWLAEEGTFTARKNVELLREFAARPADASAPRGGSSCASCVSPAEIRGGGRVEAVDIGRNEIVRAEDGTLRARAAGDDVETIECGLVLRSVGYRAVPLPDVPFDERGYVLPNERGRVLGARRRPAARRLRRRLDQARPDGDPGHQQARRRGDRGLPGRGPARRRAARARAAGRARRSTRCWPSASRTSSPPTAGTRSTRWSSSAGAPRTARGSSSPRATSCSRPRRRAPRPRPPSG